MFSKRVHNAIEFVWWCCVGASLGFEFVVVTEIVKGLNR